MWIPYQDITHDWRLWWQNNVARGSKFPGPRCLTEWKLEQRTRKRDARRRCRRRRGDATEYRLVAIQFTVRIKGKGYNVLHSREFSLHSSEKWTNLLSVWYLRYYLCVTLTCTTQQYYLIDLLKKSFKFTFQFRLQDNAHGSLYSNYKKTGPSKEG